MGEFQDVFGADACAVDIIEGYSRQRMYDGDDDEVGGWRTASKNDFKPTKQQNDIETWRASMLARGYTKGPSFSSYEELSNWDRTNSRAHIRRRNSSGFEVFFTDGND